MNIVVKHLSCQEDNYVVDTVSILKFAHAIGRTDLGGRK